MKLVSNVDQGLPMRLSARKSDPDYSEAADRLSDRIDIILDGALLGEATSYDARKGVVTRHRRDEAGKLILERGAPTFETLQGKVEVRWRREAHAEGGAA